MSDLAPANPATTSIDAAEILKLQAELETITAKSRDNLATAEECRRGVEIIRLLRRTNTGPSASRGRKKATLDSFDPLAALNQTLP